MSFVSYAQNFEDVMLWRALKHIDRGFYIDVGACSPDDDSVTRAFYQRGWRGINIEPNPAWAEPLEERRPEDTNLQVGLGEEAGVMEFNLFGENKPQKGGHGYLVGESGISTADERALRVLRTKYEVSRVVSRPVLTLNVVWESLVGEKEVHFLKIDVEGMEAEVLHGNDWSKNRPWITLVEATQPVSQEDSFKVWEPLLTENDYEFVYADGLNRFYLANEHNDLAPSFNSPPNYSDGFITAMHAEAEKKVVSLESEVTTENAKREELSSKLAVTERELKEALENLRHSERKRGTLSEEVSSLEQEVQLLNERLTKLNHHARSMETSKSWRITAPLRFIADKLRSVKRTTIRGLRPKEHKYDRASPGTAVSLLSRVFRRLSPRLYQWTRRIYRRLTSGRQQPGRLARPSQAKYGPNRESGPEVHDNEHVTELLQYFHQIRDQQGV